MPKSGRVLLGDEDITHIPAHARVAHGIALVPEGRRLFGSMTVEENLLLGAGAGRKGTWTIKRVLETFPHLELRFKARAGTLSGGEQQAAAIGRALMSNPDILLLDEVSLGLSPLVVERVYVSLSALMKTGVTVILVEQDLGRAMSVADKVICMLEGRAILEGAARDLSPETITDACFGLRGREAHDAVGSVALS
jgi:branched-chain amino acid transport system ATP-binding protein